MSVSQNHQDAPLHEDEWYAISRSDPRSPTSVTAAHLARRGLTSIEGIGHFASIEVLFLNENRLTTLNGLQGSFRLKELYVQANALSSLEPTIFKGLRHLRVLNAGSNRITELHLTAGTLCKLTLLRVLCLEKNPMAQHLAYRTILAQIKTLDYIDNVKVTAKEKMGLPQTSTRMWSTPSQKYSELESFILAKAERIKKHLKPQKPPIIAASRTYPAIERPLPQNTPTDCFKPCQVSLLLSQFFPKGCQVPEALPKAIEALYRDPLNIGRVPTLPAKELLLQSQNWISESAKLKNSKVSHFLGSVKLVDLPEEVVRQEAAKAHEAALRLFKAKDPTSYAQSHRFLKYETLIKARAKMGGQP